jgi:hypothetical protein
MKETRERTKGRNRKLNKQKVKRMTRTDKSISENYGPNLILTVL